MILFVYKNYSFVVSMSKIEISKAIHKLSAREDQGAEPQHPIVQGLYTVYPKTCAGNAEWPLPALLHLPRAHIPYRDSVQRP